MWAVALALAAGALIWLYRINAGMKYVPAEAAKASPTRWTRQYMRETYERVKRNPISYLKALPPRLDRRYVIVGGSGEPISSVYSYRLAGC